jgi:hypothetical protein
MVLYHLVSLNTMASVLEIERLVRGGGRAGKPSGAKYAPRSGCAYHLSPEDAREIYFHCGQPLRNTRLVPVPAWLPWWAGACTKWR